MIPTRRTNLLPCTRITSARSNRAVLTNRSIGKPKILLNNGTRDPVTNSDWCCPGNRHPKPKGVGEMGCGSSSATNVDPQAVTVERKKDASDVGGKSASASSPEEQSEGGAIYLHCSTVQLA